MRLLIVPSGTPSRSASSDCVKPAVVGELERLSLLVAGAGAAPPGRGGARSGSSTSSSVAGARSARAVVVERVGAPALLAADDVDGAPVDERQDPRARLRALGAERAGRAPDGQERLLHCVLGERRVAHDAQREPVRDAAVAVVELARAPPRPPRADEGEQRLVREVRVVAAAVARRRRAGPGGHRVTAAGRPPMIVGGMVARGRPRARARGRPARPSAPGAEHDGRAARALAKRPAGRAGLAVDHPELVRPAGGARERPETTRPRPFGATTTAARRSERHARRRGGRRARRAPRSSCRASRQADAQMPSTIAAAAAATATAATAGSATRRRSGTTFDACSRGRARARARAGRAGARAFGHVGERGGRVAKALELLAALLAAREDAPRTRAARTRRVRPRRTPRPVVDELCCLLAPHGSRDVGERARRSSPGRATRMTSALTAGSRRTSRPSMLDAAEQSLRVARRPARCP